MNEIVPEIESKFPEMSQDTDVRRRTPRLALAVVFDADDSNQTYDGIVQVADTFCCGLSRIFRLGNGSEWKNKTKNSPATMAKFRLIFSHCNGRCET